MHNPPGDPNRPGYHSLSLDPNCSAVTCMQITYFMVGFRLSLEPFIIYLVIFLESISLYTFMVRDCAECCVSAACRFLLPHSSPMLLLSCLSSVLGAPPHQISPSCELPRRSVCSTFSGCGSM